MLELFLGQLTDPFRIVFAGALVYTMHRTQAVSGTWMPLAFGVLFIAVILPLTVNAGGGPVLPAMIAGLFSTALIVAVILALRALVLRARGR